MKIEKLRTCHLTNPLGFQMERPVFSWVVKQSTGKRQAFARVQVADGPSMEHILYDTGSSTALSSLAVPADLTLRPRTRYYWQVSVMADDGDVGVSETAWFETGKQDEPWNAQWIRAPFPQHPILRKRFMVEQPVSSARLYLCGLGLYEARLGGQKIGDEYLAPGFDSYQHQIQYQTYDVGGYLRQGENTL